jgi:hypothetical protein
LGSATLSSSLRKHIQVLLFAWPLEWVMLATWAGCGSVWICKGNLMFDVKHTVLVREISYMYPSCICKEHKRCILQCFFQIPSGNIFQVPFVSDKNHFSCNCGCIYRKHLTYFIMCFLGIHV